MKKRAILFMGVLAAMSVNAQQVSLKKAPLTSDFVGTGEYSTSVTDRASNGPEMVFWSEDFANGIPTGWTNEVTTDAGILLPNGSWEYRGPSTTPSNATGSRGAYVGTRGPILSPSASNGFVIFDSDYMDNNGTAGNFGNGPAPAPHVAKLTTSSIDLSGQPFVELKMHAYVRQFQTQFMVAISNDGGTTYPDTVEFYQSLGTNNDGPEDDILAANISTVAGNQSNVVLQFLFNGILGTTNQAYYFWMIDDIELRTLPSNEMRFTEASDGAPEHDIIYNGGGARQPNLGHISLQQIVPINFDANVRNYGSQTQTNVTFHVEVYNNGTIVDTLKSSTVASVASQDTVTYTSFVTPQWTPSVAGDYELVYTFESDSISGMMAERDTFLLFVTEEAGSALDGAAERTSLDNGVFSNSIGTDNASVGEDGGAFASMLSFENADPGSSTVALYSLELGLSGLTVAGGDVQIEIYDTTNFDFGNGFANSAIVSRQFNVTSGGTAGLERFDLTNGNGASDAVQLNPGTYYFVVYMFSNAGNNTIRLINDQTFAQTPRASIFYSVSDSRWYTGFIDSRTINSFWIRAITDNYDGISLEENNTNSLSIYPNPTKGNVSITLAQGGKYNIEVIDMVGNIISSEEIIVNGNEKLDRNYSDLTRGIYLMNVTGEGFSKTTKLTIQ